METALSIEEPSLGTDLSRAVRAMHLEPLVGGEAREDIASLSEALGLDAQSLCLECRLSETDERVDAAYMLYSGRHLMAARNGSPSGAMASFRNPLWKRSREFLETWVAGALPCVIPFVWMAFDRDAAGRPDPVPCLSLCVDRGFYVRRMGSSILHGLEPYRPSQLRHLAADSHGRLLGTALDAETGDRLEACAAALEPFGFPKHVSFMSARDPVTVKMDVCLPLNAVVPFLKAAGRPESTEGLHEALLRFMPWNGRIQLNLVMNATAAVQPLEAEFLTLPGEAALRDRLAFADTLVSAGLCAPAKAEVLREVSLHPLREAMENGEPAVARGWYCKIRFQGDIPLDAKAYLGLEPRSRRTISSYG